MDIVSPPESAAPFFSSGHITFLIGIVGAFFSAALLPICFKLRDRRSRQRGEHIPVSSKLLRPAGYTVGVQLEAVTEQLISGFLAFAGTGGILAIAAWSSFKLLRVAIDARHQLDEFVGLIVPHYLWFFPTTLLVSGVVWCFLGRRIWRGIQRQADLRLGWRGETAVGEALSHRKVANVALAVFHDVPGDGPWNIDHIVVTRAAVFLIETKTRTKRTGRNSLEADTVECHGETLRFPYWNDEQTVAQAERNARWLRRLVAPLVPASYPIQALIVLPGWNVRNPERLKIPAMRANDLVQYIAQHAANPSSAPDESALKPLIKALDDRCRTVEF